MNPLSKLIISVCAQCDWSWHHLSFWATDGLNHDVSLNIVPAAVWTELSKHHRGFSGSWMPLSLLGLSKHSRRVCSAQRVAHEPGSVTVTWTARGHQDTTAALKERKIKGEKNQKAQMTANSDGGALTPQSTHSISPLKGEHNSSTTRIEMRTKWD